MEDIEDLHKTACLNMKNMFKLHDKDVYVLTSHFLKKRGKCCGNTCMFCPYSHQNVGGHKCTTQTCYHSINASTFDTSLQS